jgi:hypothetical protein
VIPSMPISVTASKKFAIRSGSALLNSVALILTRKPRDFASYNASTALS